MGKIDGHKDYEAPDGPLAMRKDADLKIAKALDMGTNGGLSDAELYGFGNNGSDIQVPDRPIYSATGYDQRGLIAAILADDLGLRAEVDHVFPVGTGQNANRKRDHDLN